METAQAYRILVHRRSNAVLILLLAVTVTSGYILLMRVGSLQPFTLVDLAVAMLFGGLTAMSVAMTTTARDAARACSSAGAHVATGLSGTIASLLATAVSCMCCLPLLPTLVGTLAAGTAATSSAYAATLAVERWTWLLYAGSAGLLLWSLDHASRRLVRAVESRID